MSENSNTPNLDEYHQQDEEEDEVFDEEEQYYNNEHIPDTAGNNELI